MKSLSVCAPGGVNSAIKSGKERNHYSSRQVPNKQLRRNSSFAKATTISLGKMDDANARWDDLRIAIMSRVMEWMGSGLFEVQERRSYCILGLRRHSSCERVVNSTQSAKIGGKAARERLSRSLSHYRSCQVSPQKPNDRGFHPPIMPGSLGGIRLQATNENRIASERASLQHRENEKLFQAVHCGRARREEKRREERRGDLTGRKKQRGADDPRRRVVCEVETTNGSL